MKSTRKVTSRDWPAIDKVLKRERPKTRIVVVDENDRIQGIYMNQDKPAIRAALEHANTFSKKHRVYSAPSGKLFARGHDDVLDPTTVLCEWLRTEDGRIMSIPHD